MHFFVLPSQEYFGTYFVFMLGAETFSSSLLFINVKIKTYRTIILAVVLYGCKSWSLTLRRECRLRVFENMVLWRLFTPKRKAVTWEWRRLHDVERHDLHFIPNIFRMI
jgi:hypothetical protein